MVTSALDALIRGKYKPSGGPLSGGAGSSAGGGALASQRRRLQAAAQAQGGMPNPVDAPIGLEVCDWLNVTACNATGGRDRSRRVARRAGGRRTCLLSLAGLPCKMAGACASSCANPAQELVPSAVRMSAAGQGVLVAAYNPLGWSREVALRVPVSTAATCTWTVTGAGPARMERGRRVDWRHLWKGSRPLQLVGPHCCPAACIRHCCWPAAVLHACARAPAAWALQAPRARMWRRSWCPPTPARWLCSNCWPPSMPPAPPPLVTPVGAGCAGPGHRVRAGELGSLAWL